jgi:hypothetical protein
LKISDYFRVVKLFTTSFLLFVYMFASAGVNVKVHYCGKRVSGVKIFSVEENKCCCKKKSPKANCCSEKEFQIKLDETQNIASSEITPSPKTFLNTIFILPALVVFNVFEQKHTPHFANAPPQSFPNHIYLLNSVFRI